MSDEAAPRRKRSKVSSSSSVHPTAIFPSKLARGDRLAVVAPSLSYGLIAEENRQYAAARLQSLGFNLIYGRHIEEQDVFGSSSVASRLADLHEAFADPQVKGLLTVLGGFNCNQLLQYIDYDIIVSAPKVLCGFSDTTALCNAIYSKTGLVTYVGPSYSTFSMQVAGAYTFEMFRRCLISDEPLRLFASPEWSDDRWYTNQQDRIFHPNPGMCVLSAGEARGRIVGGNLGTFLLLFGTPYMPPLQESVVFIEDDQECKPHHFDRRLQAMIHQPGFSGVRGLVIGRFQTESKMSMQILRQIVASKPELSRIPVVAGGDFGHTTPMFTFPIGGTCLLRAEEAAIELTLTEH